MVFLFAKDDEGWPAEMFGCLDMFCTELIEPRMLSLLSMLEMPALRRYSISSGVMDLPLPKPVVCPIGPIPPRGPYD